MRRAAAPSPRLLLLLSFLLLLLLPLTQAITKTSTTKTSLQHNTLKPSLVELHSGPGQKEVTLANTGIAGSKPVKGRIVGPFTSVRSTTVPWNLRHLYGAQVNGAPEPLVTRNVYKFVPSEAPPKESANQIFKDLDNMKFATPNGQNLNVQTSPSDLIAGKAGRNGLVDPSLFQSIAPQPPPFVPPVPPSPGNHPMETEAAPVEPPTTAVGLEFLQLAQTVSPQTYAPEDTEPLWYHPYRSSPTYARYQEQLLRYFGRA